MRRRGPPLRKAGTVLLGKLKPKLSLSLVSRKKEFSDNDFEVEKALRPAAKPSVVKKEPDSGERLPHSATATVSDRFQS